MEKWLQDFSKGLPCHFSRVHGIFWGMGIYRFLIVHVLLTISPSLGPTLLLWLRLYCPHSYQLPSTAGSETFCPFLQPLNLFLFCSEIWLGYHSGLSRLVFKLLCGTKAAFSAAVLYPFTGGLSGTPPWLLLPRLFCQCKRLFSVLLQSGLRASEVKHNRN